MQCVIILFAASYHGALVCLQSDDMPGFSLYGLASNLHIIVSFDEGNVFDKCHAVSS